MICHKMFVKHSLLIALLSVSIISFAHDMVHEAPWSACEEAARSDQCSYSNDNGDLYQGTCQSFNDALMCVRNKPIVYANTMALANEKQHNQSARGHDESHEH